VSQAGIHVVAAELGKAKAKVVIPPALTTLPNTQVKLNPAAILAASGVEVSFGVGSSLGEARKVFFDLMELVRAGLSPAAAIEGVTLSPARLLGVDQRVGSIEAGKDANLILFSGDPLEPTSSLLAVWLEGKKVHDARPGVEQKRKAE
jgi:imidazolonepropionase-like amidohydrolase